jgi:hypothetical protein
MIFKLRHYLLFRARTIASRPRRHKRIEGTGPEHRVKGRWFTSDINEALFYMSNFNEDAEIIAVEIDDAHASMFSVTATPRTVCGIEALVFSANPMTDYVLPAHLISDPYTVEIENVTRVRDYIDIGYTHIPKHKILKINPENYSRALPLAA